MTHYQVKLLRGKNLVSIAKGKVIGYNGVPTDFFLENLAGSW